MQLGMRPRTRWPSTHRGFHVFRYQGRFYGLPEFLDPEDLIRQGRLAHHPSALRAATRDELMALIDRLGESEARPTLVEVFEGYEFLRLGRTFFAVPQGAGPVDLDVEEERNRAGVLTAGSIEPLRRQILALKETVPVEFAGWLPIFKGMGNCGRHPQFMHTTTPPVGYRFIRSAPANLDRPKPTFLERAAAWIGKFFLAIWVAVRQIIAPFLRGPRVGLKARVRIIVSITRLFIRMMLAGGKLRPTLFFLRSRNFSSQILLADRRELVFLTSAPYTYNQNPWVIEIEDPTTLFFPFIQNGGTFNLNVTESPYYPCVKALLESEECRGILTHISSTARMVKSLFGSETIARKVHYVPMGVKAPERWQKHDQPGELEEIHLLYINSWSQHTGNLHVRGGLDVLEAFAILRERYPQLRLTMRTGLPELDGHYHQIIESGWVRVIHRFLSVEEMEALHAESHIYLLPAARIHIVSLLQAMAAGLAVVASDGWGIEEYLTHEHNGLIVKGRYGKTSWADEQAGVLREDYEPTHTPDPEVVQGLVEAVSRLVEDHELRRRLGRAARRDIEKTFSLERWNEGLKEVFDRSIHPTQ